ncbi:MAG TPA: S41 family peptidase [Candidatus Limnocylindrales bacterium]|nr:S41 family peptidase [Candidatus Limnocylindrales bacterium]
MNRSVALRGGAVALLLVIGFVAGIYVDQAYPEFVPYFGHRGVSKIDLTEVQQAARLIQADYVDTGVNASKLSQGSVQGMVSSLGDPYSIYFDPDQYKRLQQSYQGRYTGIGIYLSFNTGGYPTITGTVAGSPAAEAGLMAGDQIVKVGDKDIKGITADQATALIQGPEGTQVTITVSRGGETKSYTITRAQIQVPTVRSSVVGDRVLYVRIYQFGAETSTEFSKALTNGLPGSAGAILDLRGDPGGFISAADDVITQFVSSGETFETRGRNGTDRHQVGSKHAAPSVPLVVLVDANSASAAEIVAGSLQVHKRARLVGTTTFGKGSVQQDFVLSDGSDLHLTVERWYLPNGVTIDHKGLTPDVMVTLAHPTDAYDVTQPSQGYANDAQLNTALGLLAGG